MKVKEINVSIKFTKNLGNYQSFTAEAGAIAVVEDGEMVHDVYNNMWAVVKEQVSSQIKSLKTDGGMI